MSDVDYLFGPFQLLPRRRLLLRDGVPQRLGGRALDVLLVLVRRSGEVLSQDELTSAVWPRTVVAENNLRVHIAAVRKILGDSAADSRYIVSIPLRGYSFVAPVRVERERSAETTTTAAGDPLRGGMPAMLGGLIGRDGLVDDIATSLAAQRFITLIGPGGIGKTSVALAVAHRVRDRYPEPPYFIDLAAVADARGVPSVLAAPLGLAVSADADFRGLAPALRERHMLIVLDNCEHLLDAAAELAEALCRAAPQVHLLATSREALRAEGEHVVRLPALTLPDAHASPPVDAQEALGFSAMALFAERAAAGQDDFRLTPSNIALVAQICRSLDGIPLAIELAAAHVQAFGVQMLAEHLTDRLVLLTQGRRTAAPRQHTLRAALDWSYALLDGQEQSLLRSLSVFQGVFTLEAALAAADPTDPGALLEGVSQLVAKSLVTTDPAGEIMRYRLLETTRAYAQEKLLASGERDRSARRHASYFLGRAVRAQQEEATQEPGTWLTEYANDLGDLRAALAWAFSAEGDAAVGVELVASSAPLWFALSLLHEYNVWIDLALSRPRTLPAILEMQLRDAQGHTLWHASGLVEQVRSAFERQLALAELHGVQAQRLAALRGLWLHTAMRGDYAHARDLALRFGAHASSTRDPKLGTTATRMLALSDCLCGRLGDAEAGFRQVLMNAAPGRRPVPLGMLQFEPRVAACAALARTLWLSGQADNARSAAEEAASLARAFGHDLSLFYALTVAAIPVALWTGDVVLARERVDLLVQRSGTRSLKLWEAHGQGYTRALELRLGSSTNAVLPPEVRQLTGWQLLEMLATLDESLADPGLLERANLTPPSWCTAELLRIRAHRLCRDGQAQEAEATLWRALEIAQAQGAAAWQLRCATSLAQLLRGGPRAAKARGRLEAVIAGLQQGQDTPDLQHATEVLITVS